MKTLLQVLATPFILAAFALMAFAEIVILGRDGDLGDGDE